MYLRSVSFCNYMYTRHSQNQNETNIVAEIETKSRSFHYFLECLLGVGQTQCFLLFDRALCTSTLLWGCHVCIHTFNSHFLHTYMNVFVYFMCCLQFSLCALLLASKKNQIRFRFCWAVISTCRWNTWSHLKSCENNGASRFIIYVSRLHTEPQTNWSKEL